MFKILLTQNGNTSKLTNHQVGIFNINLVPQAKTGLQYGNKLCFDINQCKLAMNNLGLKSGYPTLFEIDHIDNTNDGCKSLSELLELFHNATGHGSQVGVYRFYPMSKLVKSFSPEHMREVIAAPYKPNKLDKSSISKLVQFVVCWAFPYVSDWDEWETIVSAAIDEAKQFNKPVYAITSLTYHPGSPYLRNRIISPERISWMIQKAYECKCDGIIINSALDPSSICYETMVNMLNQINE